MQRNNDLVVKCIKPTIVESEFKSKQLELVAAQSPENAARILLSLRQRTELFNYTLIEAFQCRENASRILTRLAKSHKDTAYLILGNSALTKILLNVRQPADTLVQIASSNADVALTIINIAVFKDILVKGATDGMQKIEEILLLHFNKEKTNLIKSNLDSIYNRINQRHVSGSKNGISRPGESKSSSTNVIVSLGISTSRNKASGDEDNEWVDLAEAVTKEAKISESDEVDNIIVLSDTENELCDSEVDGDDMDWNEARAKIK